MDKRLVFRGLKKKKLPIGEPYLIVESIIESAPFQAADTFLQRESIVSSNKRNAEFMRQLKQYFKIEGLKPGEKIPTVEFDGISITPENK